MTTPSTFKTRGLLSTGDIAKRQGVHRTTVWHWLKSGMLAYVAVTPRFKGVTEEALATFLATWVPDQAVSPKSKPSSKKKAGKKPVKKPKAAKKAA